MSGGNWNSAQSEFVKKVVLAVAGPRIFELPVNVVAYIAQETLRSLAQESEKSRKKILNYRNGYRDQDGTDQAYVERFVLEYAEEFGSKCDSEREEI